MKPIPLTEIIEVLQVKPPHSGDGRTPQPALPLLLLDQHITGVCTDSRLVQHGDLFVALRGERTDGHQYLQEVFDKGAVCALVEYIPIGAEEMPLLRVPSTVQALGKLAQHYRRQMPATVIGITGSTGKTTTKEMLACALEAEYPNAVHKNAGNYNTEIGVPLTLFGLEPHHRFLVQEMAMRGRGQIAYLAEIAEPQIGIITQIGWSHVELLGSRQAIAEAKAELLDSLPPDGIAILPRDDRFYEFLRTRCRNTLYTFGKHEDADAQMYDVELYPDHTACKIRFAEHVPLPPNSQRIVTLDLPHLGEHLLYNATAVLLTAVLLGIPPQKAVNALQRLQLPEMRMNIQRQPGGWMLINDAYNANPDSMRSALNVLTRQAPAQRRIAILGDMKELGTYSMRLHWHLGRWLATQPLDYLVLVGIDVLWTAAAAKEGGFPAQRILHFETPLQAGEWLARHVQKGDWVLLKGSRAVGLEQALVQA